MKSFSCIFQGVLLLVFLNQGLPVRSQVAPEAEPVFGGYIQWIDAIPVGTTGTRVFISTRSPNSMFYMDVSGVTSPSPSFSDWTVLPDLDEAANYGFIRCFGADETSGYLYINTEGGKFLSANTSSGSLHELGNFFVNDIAVKNGYLFYQTHYGPDELLFVRTLDINGHFTSYDSTLIATSAGWSTPFQYRIIISPYDNYIYFFVPGKPPKIYKSSDPYTSISHTTTWSSVSVSDLNATGKEYLAFNIAPDGRFFCGSYEGNSSAYTARVCYSDTGGDPWTSVIVSEDCGRGPITISPIDGSDYRVYFSRVISSDKGSSWSMHGGADGAICADPTDIHFAYVRTDWGMGYYNGYSSSKVEHNDELLAVQVNDFGMNSSKNTAWVASKSGMWHVSNYGSGTPVWTDPIWPLGHTVPWTRLLCSPTADTLFCGNNDADLFRHEGADGPYTDPSSYEQIFSARTGTWPYYVWSYGTRVSAIAADPDGSGRIFVGLYDDEDFGEPEHLGAIFSGHDSAGAWVFRQIYGSPIPNTGCDVNDIVAVTENGHTTLYVGVERNITYGTVNGIYRLEETSPDVWVITSDLFTGPGYPISATIMDLAITDDNYLLACGTDASGTTVVSYIKAVGTTYWSVLPTAGLTPPNTGRAITYDPTHHDTYMAVDNSIFKLGSGGSSWTNYWTYPVGTQIQFIYYDDLLVGTGTGLYKHTESVGEEEAESFKRSELLITVVPNPSHGETKLHMLLRQPEKVRLEIIDLTGRKVALLADTPMGSGNFTFSWPSESNSGIRATPGLYFYRLTLENYRESGKIMLLP